jgi:hypothetical protein
LSWKSSFLFVPPLKFYPQRASEFSGKAQAVAPGYVGLDILYRDIDLGNIMKAVRITLPLDDMGCSGRSERFKRSEMFHGSYVGYANKIVPTIG